MIVRPVRCLLFWTLKDKTGVLAYVRHSYHTLGVVKVLLIMQARRNDVECKIEDRKCIEFDKSVSTKV